MRSSGRFRPGRNDARRPVSAVCELINGVTGVGGWGCAVSGHPEGPACDGATTAL